MQEIEKDLQFSKTLAYQSDVIAVIVYSQKEQD